MKNKREIVNRNIVEESSSYSEWVEKWRERGYEEEDSNETIVIAIIAVGFMIMLSFIKWF